MIFDFDVHHGNGTNDVFYEDEDVLFVSTHQQGSYPGTGKLADVGSGSGEGTSINLPLPGGLQTCSLCGIPSRCATRPADWHGYPMTLYFISDSCAP